MAVRWNSELCTAMEHKDLQANAMAVDNTGTFVLLAGRRYLAIRNLDDNDIENVKKFPRQSKYDVRAAEWNPNFNHSDLCVISCNQRLEVFTWRSDLIQIHSLRAHTRVITDLNWHHTDPNLLASCSVDTFIHIWDLRDSRRPTLSLSAIAEASQVRWNKISSNLLATAHDGDIKLWDQRKGTAPIQYIAAHLAKIHGLDWNPHSEAHLATSSQDNTVKFFDINSPKRPECMITTNAPVWRARYTPFGNGLVTVVVPQLRRGENSLLLWNTANRSTPVHTFVGHRDVVLEFEWRKQRYGDSDFQLVTWSKDQTLLVWKIDHFLQKLCGYEPDDIRDDEPCIEAVENNLQNKTEKSSPKVQPLQKEFSLLNVHIPNLEVLKMDPIQRSCTVRANFNNCLVNLQVNFPDAYPFGVAPVFQILQGSSVEESVSAQILQTLSHIAQQRVLKNRTCLESCLRQFVATLEKYQTTNTNHTYNEPITVLGSFNDAYIPFPRTSGAKFCSVSHLVCFGGRRKLETSTPRALSALETMFGGKKQHKFIPVSSYYYQKPKQSKSRQWRPTVQIYDASGLFLMNRQLAEEYILDGDVGTICRYNAEAALGAGRMDLVQAWTLAELVASPQLADEDNMWSMHPFGNQLMPSLIAYYAGQSDIQTAAMLSCIFGKEQDVVVKKCCSKFSSSVGSGSYHAIPPADVVDDGWVFPLLRTTRSNSLDNLKLEENKKEIPQKTSGLMLYEYYKLAYAETLHRWGLLYKRAEVLKYKSLVSESPRDATEFLVDCLNCKRPSKQCSCASCKRPVLQCVICHITVRGSANCCLVCGHGGHALHMQCWFAQNDVCPSGCGCQCPIEMSEVFGS